jgi:WD40 repeat protein
MMEKCGHKILGVSPEGNYAVTYYHGTRNAFLVWDLESFQIINTLPISRLGSLVGFVVGSNGRYAVSATQSGQVKIWRLKDGKSWTPLSNELSLKCISLAPSGDWLAVGGSQGMRIFNLKQTDDDIRCLTGHTSGVTCLAYSHDSSMIATGSLDRSVHIYESHTRRSKLKLSAPVFSLSFSTSCLLLYVAQVGKDVIKEYNARTGQLYRDIQLAQVCIGTPGSFVMDGVHAAHLLDDGHEVEMIHLPTGASRIVTLKPVEDDHWNQSLIKFSRLEPNLSLILSLQRVTTKYRMPVEVWTEIEQLAGIRGTYLIVGAQNGSKNVYIDYISAESGEFVRRSKLRT